MAAAKGDSSKSERLRKKGNEIYLQLRGAGRFATPVQRAKLTRAHELYAHALAESCNPDDRASCMKNAGNLHWLWTKFEMDVFVSRAGERGDLSELALCKSKLFMSVDFLLKALHEGAGAAKSQEWLDNLVAVLAGIVDWTSMQADIDLHFLDSAPILRYLCQAFDVSLSNSPVTCEPAVVAHIRFAEKLLQQGKEKLEGEDSRNIRASVSLLHHCLETLQRAVKLPGNHPLKKCHQREIEDLQDRARLHMYICESVQARATADEILNKAVSKDKMNMDLVCLCLDFYRQAALSTRERDLENEAIATSRMGKMLSEYFRNNDKAAQYHYQAVRLASLVMSPRITGADWYFYSLRKIEEHQAKVVQVEEMEHEKEREPVKIKITGKLKKIQIEGRKDAESFLRYIYQEHPNADPRKQPGEMFNSKIGKQTLKKAMSHYHPDVNGKYGKEWQVLCEEIFKVLNNKYEYYKGL